MTRSDIPSLITGLRILLVLPVLMALFQGYYGWVLGLFALAGISDGLDGFLARHYGWHSRLGAIVDPIADKLLMVALYLGLGILAHLPWWLVALVIGRDLVIVGGALSYYALIGRFDMEPTLVSKLNTVLQILLVLLVVVGLWGYGLAPWALQGLIALVTLSTLASGVNYVWVWSRRAQQVGRRRR